MPDELIEDLDALPDGIRLGKREAEDRPALRLSRLLTGIVPEHPAQVDYITQLSGWKMLGNDRYGDCVTVTWANHRRQVTRLVGRERYPGLDECLELYRTQNPGFPTQDEGMYVQQALDHLRKNGGPDGVKAVAFAKVDHHNLDEVKAAVAIFGGVWIGTVVQRATMTDFDQGKPWAYHPGSPTIGGHAILGGGYDSDHRDADLEFITWASVTGFTEEGWLRLVDECWIVIWPEHLQTQAFLEGVDRAELAAAFHELTGKDLVLPDAPTPDPGAATFPLDPDLAPEVARRAARAKVTESAWINARIRKYLQL